MIPILQLGHKLRLFSFVFFILIINTKSFSQTTWKETQKLAAFYAGRDSSHIAIHFYEISFLLGNKTPYDLYNAACCYSILKQVDSAFSKLNLAIDYGYNNIGHLEKDKDFHNIRRTIRWNSMITMLKHKQHKLDVKYGPIRKQLEKAYASDQAVRILLLDTIFKKYGENSVQADSTKQRMREIDSLNVNFVKAVLDKYGWLGPSEIGDKAALTIFLLIQHSDSTTQEKYVPFMRAAVHNGKAASQNLALLEDRILYHKGKKQIYGSQVVKSKTSDKYELYPIEDEKNINNRRQQVGLPPIEEYLRNFGIDYKPQ